MTYFSDGVTSETLLFFHGLTVDHRASVPLARALPNLRVVAPDLPGHGHTPPAANWTPRAIAADLAKSWDGRFALVGHSWGGAIAVWLAALYPERVSALVLLEGGWFDRTDLPPTDPPENRAHAAALQALTASRTSEAWPAIAAAQIPVLAVAGGREDRSLRQRLLTGFQNVVPNAQTVLVDAAGHDLLGDAPAQVGAVLREWFVHANSSRDMG